MPGCLTDYTTSKLLDLVFGATAYLAPETLFIGLSQTTSNRAGIVNEPSGGGYSRVGVINSPASFPAASLGTKSNSMMIVFSSPTADWGTVQSLFVSDAPSGGNVLAMADLTSFKQVLTGGSPPKVAIGALSLSYT